jgi:hypothetical protein
MDRVFYTALSPSSYGEEQTKYTGEAHDLPATRHTTHAHDLPRPEQEKTEWKQKEKITNLVNNKSFFLF